MLTRGFTLFELLVTLAVVVVLVTVAVPSFSELIHNNRRTTAVNSLIRSFHLARSEAIKRGRDVVVCPTDKQNLCVGKTVAWSGGWLVFVNADQDVPEQWDTGEHILWRQSPHRGLSIRANRRAFVLRAYGRHHTNGTVVFCDQRGSVDARAVIVSITGRPRVSPKDASGKALVCGI